uniref:cysteine desulfurase family protein n=1 Tax=Jutongia sp. TaxID=2944204 RepID=UPI0030806F57
MEVRYFDNSATTRIKEEILTEMFPFLSREYGNPSSLYSIGRKSKRAIEEARKRVASLINCNSEEIYFTSCGSESDNTALKGIAYANSNKGKHIITSKIEHPAILHSCQNLEKKGFEVTYLDVDKDGFVNLQTLENSIRQDTILISVMFANNEIGTIEPIQEIAKIAHKNGIIFHTDAVQACGNIPIDVQKMDIDMLSLSGHKIYAPKGIGALYVKKGIEFERFMDGGHQEKNKRSGTENVAEIVALGKACQIAEKNMEQYQNKLKLLRDYCLEKMKKSFSNIHINGTMEKRLPGNINISFDIVPYFFL